MRRVQAPSRGGVELPINLLGRNPTMRLPRRTDERDGDSSRGDPPHRPDRRSSASPQQPFYVEIIFFSTRGRNQAGCAHFLPGSSTPARTDPVRGSDPVFVEACDVCPCELHAILERDCLTRLAGVAACVTVYGRVMARVTLVAP
jgi:hypothetical protein